MRAGRTAWIINVGNELLLGTVVNTNAAWLARKLSFLGFDVERIIVVPDREGDVVQELRRAMGSGVGLVITTGGLGPTYDDRTLEFVAKAIGRGLVLNREALEMVRRYYASAGMELTEERVKMAKLPAGAKPLPNPVGAAPGSLLEADGTVIVSLPGVPKEMEAMFEEHVERYLLERLPPMHTAERFVCTRGVPESSLAPYLRKLASVYPSAYVKSHPRGREVGEPVLRVQVLVRSEAREEAERQADELARKVAEKVVELGGSIVDCQ